MDVLPPLAEPAPREVVVRAFVKQVLPLSVLFLLLAGCAGFLPPWSVCGTLFCGASAAWVLHCLRRDRIAVAVACGVAVTSIILLWPHVNIRAAAAADRTYQRYFGGPRANFTARNIAVVDGTFTLGTWLTGQLFHVQDGRLQELNAFSVGRSSNQIGAPHWEPMRITLALVQYESDHGSITQLGSAGESRGGGRSNEVPTTVTRRYSKLESGPLFFGRSRILYVEGDSEIQLSSDMTAESFAQVSKGAFYVVVVGLH